VQYIAGQGIRPEKYLIGITDVKEGTSDQKCGNRYFDFANGLHTLDSYCKENDILYFGRSLNMNYNKDNNAYSNKTFWFDTENITSPAIILLQKMAAAAQAQFNLAQQAYKYPADNSTTSTSTIRNTSGDCDNNKEFCEEITFDKPTINELPAPWEDDNDYAKLPQEYIDDWTGTHPDDIGDIYGAGYYLNSWYKDITQMYLQKDEEDTFIRTLKNWFCIEDDKGLDTSCFNQRDPKYYEP
jgi:hypothetical protein